MTAEEDRTDIDVTYRIRNPFSESKRFIYFISAPPHLIKNLRNSLLSSGYGRSARLMWNAGYDILWKHITDIFYEDLECGLHLLPKVTNDHINLTSYSKMNVRLATQVLSSSVSNVIKKISTPGAAGTATFCEMADNFFDCMNVRNTQEGNRKLKPFLKPYVSANDERFNWLLTDLLQYFEQWKISIQNRTGRFTKDEQSKMFISWQTYEGIKITVHSTVELVKFVLNNDVPYVLSGKFSQDILENYNGRQRALGCRKDNPTLRDFGYNNNTIRNSKIFKPIAGGNSEFQNEDNINIDERKLPCRKTKRKQLFDNIDFNVL